MRNYNLNWKEVNDSPYSVSWDQTWWQFQQDHRRLQAESPKVRPVCRCHRMPSCGNLLQLCHLPPESEVQLDNRACARVMVFGTGTCWELAYSPSQTSKGGVTNLVPEEQYELLAGHVLKMAKPEMHWEMNRNKELYVEIYQFPFLNH